MLWNRKESEKESPIKAAILSSPALDFEARGRWTLDGDSGSAKTVTISAKSKMEAAGVDPARRISNFFSLAGFVPATEMRCHYNTCTRQFRHCKTKSPRHGRIHASLGYRKPITARLWKRKGRRRSDRTVGEPPSAGLIAKESRQSYPGIHEQRPRGISRSTKPVVG